MRQKTDRENRKHNMWKIILAILTLIFFAVLELGKHTVIGWILTAAVLCAFIFLRIKLPDGAGRGLRSLAWIGLPAVFAVILWISRPPVKPVPALERTSGQEAFCILRCFH